MTTLKLNALPVAPRVRSVPGYKFTSGVEAIELAESVGMVPDPWQKDTIYDLMAEDDAGKWSTFEGALVEPRQNGKGTILEIVDLADLVLFSNTQRDFLSISTAHEFKTVQEAFRRTLYWFENVDWLRKKVLRVRTSHGDEGIEMRNGARLRFLARSGGSGRGFSADRLKYDEAYDLPDETIAASLPTMSARPNPSVIYTSSAPLDGIKSAALRRVMRRGRREASAPGEPIPNADPNLCYLEYSADPKADVDDPEAWRQANPAVASGRMSLEFIAKERSAMSEVAFARERLGILDESKGATVVDLDLWDELGDPLATPLDPVAFAIDVNPDSSYSSIAVSGKTADGNTFAQVVKRERGTGWVIDEIERLVTTWKPTSVTLDAIGPAGSLLPGFAERNIAIDVVSMAQYGQACGAFKAMVEERRLVHNAQTGLRAALDSARTRPLGTAGAWGWHRRDTTDITPLVAVTLATYAHTRTSAPVEDVDSRMFVWG